MNKKRFKILTSYYKPQRLLFAGDLACGLMMALAAIAIPLVIRKVTSEIIYWEGPVAVRGLIIATCVAIALLLIQAACDYFVTHYGHIMGARIESAMREDLFRHYQRLSFSFFDEQKIGQLMSRVTSDLFDITELLHHGPEIAVTCTVRLLGSLVVLLVINWRLALIAFIPVPFIAVFAVIYNRKMSSVFIRNRARIADINATMEDSLAGVRVVKSFANEDAEVDKFGEANRGFLRSKKDSYRYMANYHTVLGIATTLITIAVACGGSALMLAGYIDISTLLVFLLYVSSFTQPIRELAFLAEMMQNGFSGFIRFSEMMEVEPEITDVPDAFDLTEVNGDIRFNNVDFSYKSGDGVFEGLNLDIGAGDYVALVGTSGVGKTTLCNLIPRFYEVTGGCVTVDGHDVRTVTAKSLRSSIGMVQQDVYLFAGSVMENIRYGKPGASDEEVFEAAKRANAHDFIMSFPKGYDTDIGQRGLKLSGGQKQRLSIARVFLKNPPILIFDEATSSLDNESERIVQESLEDLARGRTTLVIAHRLSTIHNAKRILVLAKEGVVEDGTHNELIGGGGQYAALYNAAVL